MFLQLRKIFGYGSYFEDQLCSCFGVVGFDDMVAYKVGKVLLGKATARFIVAGLANCRPEVNLLSMY